jgi:hypothetical protein
LFGVPGVHPALDLLPPRANFDFLTFSWIVFQESRGPEIMPLSEEDLASIERRIVELTRGIDRSNPQSTCQQTFGVAANFHIAAVWCSESRTVAGMVQSPSVAMIAHFAFAIELYLKCILRERSRATKGHDLEVLFNRLPKEDRRGIEEKLAEISPAAATRFPTALPAFGRAFEEWRYIFESNTEKPISVYVLAELARACFLYIRDEHRDWPNAAVVETLAAETSQIVAAITNLGGGLAIRARI